MARRRGDGNNRVDEQSSIRLGIDHLPHSRQRRSVDRHRRQQAFVSEPFDHFVYRCLATTVLDAPT